MFYTALYGHLEKEPKLRQGQALHSGARIGRMGNTGASDGAHLHFGCAKGYHETIFSLDNLSSGDIRSAHEQINYFIDDDLFQTEILVTTYYNCPDYFRKYKKCHMGYDVVPLNRHQTDKNFDIFWNRSHAGTVVKTGFHNGYGYFALISFSI